MDSPRGVEAWDPFAPDYVESRRAPGTPGTEAAAAIRVASTSRVVPTHEAVPAPTAGPAFQSVPARSTTPARGTVPALATLLALAGALAAPIALSLPLSAQAAPAVEAADPTIAESRIRSLEAEESRALVARDRATLTRLWAPDFTVNAPRNVVVQGREGVLALLDNGVLDYAHFERDIEVVRIDGDMAVVMGRETVHPRGSAPMAGQVVQRRYTNVWRLRGREWVQVARHAHVIAGG